MPSPALQRLAASPLLRQFLRFAMVGVLATASHYTVLIVLKEVFGVPFLGATSTGYIVGALVSYTLNRRFTFSARPAYGRGLAKFLVVVTIGFFLNGAIASALHHWGLPYLLAQAAATGLVLTWNFTGARFIVFREKPAATPQ